MKKIFINSIIIFIIASISHFIYDLLPNSITLIFFPVNESIWEHLKLVFTSGVIFSLINLIISKEKNNFFYLTFSRSILLVIILLILYLPIYYLFGENLIVTLIILFITILITEYIISKLTTKKHYKTLNFISASLILVSYFIFTYLTYNPCKFDLFRDPQSNTYGLDK